MKQKNYFNAIKLMVCMLFVSTAFSQEVSFLEKSKVTNEGLYFWYPDDQNGDPVKAFHYAASISPRGDCFTVVNDYMFFGWYKGGMKNGRDLMISRKKIGSDKWVTVQLPHKNTLIGPRVNSWGDSHNTISVGVSKTDGTIHIFYDHHNDPLKYIVSKKNAAFVKDSDFKIDQFNRTRGYLAEGQNITITYPQVTENDQGDLIVNYRKGSAVGGNEMVHVYNSRTSTWSKSKMVIRGSGRPHVEVKDRNYAYGSPPVLAGGNLYYGFSVRWARKKPDGILNEGIYIANGGPTMTSPWEDIAGETQTLPVQDYSPFLIALPESAGGKGSSGGPSLAVSDEGDVHISFRSRGQDSKYYHTYIRKAGEKTFTKHTGIAKTGIAYKGRIYHTSINKSQGIITVQSTKAGTFDYRDDLVYDSKEKLGSTSVRLVNGKLVIIAEDRSNTKTDSQNIFSFVFQIGMQEDQDDVVITPPVVDGDNIEDIWFNVKNVETGKFLDSNESALDVGNSTEGVDKQWRFVKVGDYYNIESRKSSGTGRGILRGVGSNNSLVVTNFPAPNTDVDKQWVVTKLEDGNYTIKARTSLKYLNNETDNSTLLVDQDNNSAKWTFIDSSSRATLSTANIDVQEESAVFIYPNPSKGAFNVVLSGINKAEVSVINMYGKTIFKTQTTLPNLQVSRSAAFSSGIYIVKVIDKNKNVYLTKLVIE